MTTTRTRSSDGRSRTNTRWTEHQNPPGTAIVNMPAGYSGTQKTVLDCPHPHFRSRIARGEVILGDFSRSSVERTYVSGNVNWKHNSSIYNVDFSDDIMYWFESYFPPFATNPGIGGDLINMSTVALIRAMAKANTDGRVMTGEICSDLSKTIGMLRRPFSNSLKLLSKMTSRSKRIRGSAKTIAKANASAWLEYRYGWKPLLLDASQVVDNAYHILTRSKIERHVARAGQRSSRKWTESYFGKTSGLTGAFSLDGSVTTDQEASANAGVIYEIHNGSLAQQLANDYRVGSDSIVQTVWEIIPYSFVVDWFMQIGPWLEAIIPNPNVTVLGNWVTTVAKNNYSYVASNPQSKVAGYTASGNPGSSVIKSNYVERKVNQPLPNLPPLPNFDFSSVTHAVDGVALALPKILRMLESLRH